MGIMGIVWCILSDVNVDESSSSLSFARSNKYMRFDISLFVGECVKLIIGKYCVEFEGICCGIGCLLFKFVMCV